MASGGAGPKVGGEELPLICELFELFFSVPFAGLAVLFVQPNKRRSEMSARNAKNGILQSKNVTEIGKK